MAKKGTKASVLIKVNQILDLYLKGYTYTKILRYASEQGWGISDRGIDDLCAKARVLMAKNNEEKIKDTCNKILSCQWDLYEECKKNRNTGVARLLLVDIGKTTNAVTSVAVQEEIESTPEAIQLSSKDLKKQIKNAG